MLIKHFDSFVAMTACLSTTYFNSTTKSMYFSTKSMESYQGFNFESFIFILAIIGDKKTNHQRVYPSLRWSCSSEQETFSETDIIFNTKRPAFARKMSKITVYIIYLFIISFSGNQKVLMASAEKYHLNQHVKTYLYRIYKRYQRSHLNKRWCGKCSLPMCSR